MSGIILGNPVRGPIHPETWARPPGNDEFKITQDFGPSNLGVEPTVIWPGGDGIAAGTYQDFHQGLDLGVGGCGADVIAAASGRVDFAGIDGTGNRVVILDHGRYRTWYGHLGAERVSVGQSVGLGYHIGDVGMSAATLCHLHFALEWLDFDTVVAIRPSGRGYTKFVDPERHLAQNVRVRPTGAGVNLRSSAGSGTTYGPIYASTKPDGTIRRHDGKYLGQTAAWRDWAWPVAGAHYPDDGGGDKWERMWLVDRWVYLASPYAQRSI